MNSPLVHCIILSWNGRPLTLECVRSTLHMTYTNRVVVVVDNHSEDGTVAALRAEYASKLEEGELVLIENSSNLGFAAGNNVGMHHAIERGADYVLLLNNDTVVDAALLDELVKEAEAHPEVGIAGPKIYYHDPPDRIWFAGGEVFLHRGVSRHRGIREMDRGQYDAPAYCDYVTGCAMLIKRNVLVKSGYLDPAYPLYAEDTDYCFRAARLGFRMYYVPGAKVWHKISSSTGGQVNWRKISLRLRSSFLFHRKYARWYHWVTIPFFVVADGIRVAVLIATGGIRNR